MLLLCHSSYYGNIQLSLNDDFQMTTANGEKV